MRNNCLRTALFVWGVVAAPNGIAQILPVTVQVAGTSDPWLAGMPAGSTASCNAGACDTAPMHSPAQVDGIPIVPGTILQFAVKGQVAFDPDSPALPVHHLTAAENGISDISASTSSLVGVFLGPDAPDATPAPATGDALPRPALKQVFPIGSAQSVVVPPGATRLYLGVMEESARSNNSGSSSVTVTAAPSPGIPTPVISAGTTTPIQYVLHFSDPAGWEALTVVNVLVNDALDGRHACYLAYTPVDNMLYLVNDEGTALLPGLRLIGTGSVANSQCTVYGQGSSVFGSGDTMTLNLNIGFQPSFVGNRIIYLAARDNGANSGWLPLGLHTIPADTTTFPNPVGMDPAPGTAPAAIIKFTYQDAASANNLQTVWALFNTSLDGRGACYLAYYAPANRLFLVPDNGAGDQAPSIVLSGSDTVSNSQCTVSAQGSSAVFDGTQLTLNLNISFRPSFAGFKVAWMAAQTKSGQTSAWQALGAWNVPGS